MQSKEPFSVSIRNAKNTKKRGKRVFSLSFLDPSSPRLASGFPEPPNYFRVNEPACLGELVTSGVSISSLGQAAIALSAHFPINRHARDAKERFQHLVVKELREERKKKKKEEETKLRRYQIMTMINFYIILRSVFFMRPSASFVVKF